MLDTVKRAIVSLFPFPQTQGTENEQLAFCRDVQIAINRCQSRMDSLSVLFSNRRYEECLLVVSDVLPRLSGLHNKILQALQQAKHGDREFEDKRGDQINQLAAYVTTPAGSFTEEHRKALALLIESLEKFLAATRKLFAEYREQQPVFAQQYAFVGKRLLPFAIAFLLIGIFVAGICAATLFGSFKDQDIRFNWLAGEIHPRTVIQGVELAERDGSLNTMFAWGMGPRTSVAFNCPGAFQFALNVLVIPCLKDQYVDIVINGKDVKRITNATGSCAPGDRQPDTFLFKSRKGVNTIDFVYSDWNTKTTQYLDGEPRPLSGRFYTFSLKRTYE